jgi:hypothetical protein
MITSAKNPTTTTQQHHYNLRRSREAQSPSPKEWGSLETSNKKKKK